MATSNEAEKARHALRRRRRLRQVLGAVVCVLVVIGLASVISGGVRLTASLFVTRPNRANPRLKNHVQTNHTEHKHLGP